MKEDIYDARQRHRFTLNKANYNSGKRMKKTKGDMWLTHQMVPFAEERYYLKLSHGRGQYEYLKYNSKRYLGGT